MPDVWVLSMNQLIHSVWYFCERATFYFIIPVTVDLLSLQLSWLHVTFSFLTETFQVPPGLECSFLVVLSFRTVSRSPWGLNNTESWAGPTTTWALWVAYHTTDTHWSVRSPPALLHIFFFFLNIFIYLSFFFFF